MLGLAGRAMAQLAVQRLFPAQLVLDPATVAVRLILDVKLVVLLVYPVWRALLPLIFALGAVLSSTIVIGTSLLALLSRHACFVGYRRGIVAAECGDVSPLRLRLWVTMRYS